MTFNQIHIHMHVISASPNVCQVYELLDKSNSYTIFTSSWLVQMRVDIQTTGQIKFIYIFMSSWLVRMHVTGINHRMGQIHMHDSYHLGSYECALATDTFKVRLSCWCVANQSIYQRTKKRCNSSGDYEVKDIGGYKNSWVSNYMF